MRELAPRAHAVLLDGNSVALVRHVSGGSVWYEAPGVAVEPGETPGNAAARAARDVLGVDVAVGELVYADTEHGLEHYFFVVEAGRGTKAHMTSPDVDVALVRRAALLAYRVEPRQLARLLSRHEESAVTDW